MHLCSEDGQGKDVPGGLDLSQDLSPIGTVTLDYSLSPNE